MEWKQARATGERSIEAIEIGSRQGSRGSFGCLWNETKPNGPLEIYQPIGSDTLGVETLPSSSGIPGVYLDALFSIEPERFDWPPTHQTPLKALRLM